MTKEKKKEMEVKRVNRGRGHKTDRTLRLGKNDQKAERTIDMAHKCSKINTKS